MEMLELSKVDKVVDKAAASVLKRALLSHVFSRPTIDSGGQEALWVTIVVKRGLGGKVTGEAALNALFKISQDLLNAGEERFPIVSWMTEEDLDDDADPEC